MTGDESKFTAIESTNGGNVIYGDNNTGKVIGIGKRVFHYEDDGRERIKRGIVQRIESSWRNARNHLFHKVYDEELTFEENLKRKPAGIEANHWKMFLEYRLNEDIQEKCKKNAINRSKQLYTHTGGSKTMARKRHEEEHPGRVRGLSFGPCPSQYFRNNPQQSDYGVHIEEYQMEIVKLKAEVAELKAAVEEEKAKRQRMEAEAAEEKAKMQTMENLLRYIIQQQGGNVPPEIAANLDSLRSAPTSSHAI
ncbi:uncharacterized protein LOC130975270 [Arachis stenosperma]|uniref:uncharacterized protein LOC130975270 n=1 Tax=Arachis stenosperma TaxID=217475 RepID=UPI0025AB6D02|nr:uncharacterized protein LOC130975270 [Arachis stenosperma]